MKKEKSSILTDLVICLIIVFGIYFQTLNRSWIFYDEYAIYDETIAIIVKSFSEIFEIINSFGLTNNFGSVNLLYSSNSVNRANVLGEPLLLFLGFFFKKTALLYHLLNLFLHLINTILIYLILRNCLSSSKLLQRTLSILLTLLWALHPVHVESVLLTTNIGATLVYILFFSLFYDFIKNKEKNKLFLRRFLLPIFFLISMLLNEYIVALPLILFAYSFIENYKTNPFKSTLKKTFDECFPYLVGLFIYLICFSFSSYRFFQQSNLNPIVLTLERICWLSPQIIIHYIKLIFYPKLLSIDQSAHILLGKSFFDSYSIFCFLFLFSLLFLPLAVFLWKRKCFLITLTVWLFIISLLPFSQILSPTYCLAAERYLYTPLFFIVFGSAQILNEMLFIKSGRANHRFAPTVLILLSLLLIVYTTRSYFRTLDWKNNFTLLNSTIKTSSNSLYKGFRFNDLENLANNKKTKEKYFLKAKEYYYTAINELKKEKKIYKNEPLILKSYGLDYNSLLIKAVYLINLLDFTHNEETYKICLERFKPYLKYIDQFEPRILELYANLLIKNNTVDSAKKIFLYTYKKYPTSPFILVSLIRFERDIEKDLRSTKVYLDQARKLYPYSKDILFEALRYYQLENNLAEYAIHSYLYGLRAHSKFTYHEALTSFLILGQLKEAKQTIDNLVALDNSDPRTYYLASSYYIKKNNYNEAKTLLHKAYSLIQANKSDTQLAFDITNTLSTLYLSEGDTQQASYYAKEALNFAKESPLNLEKIKNLIKALGT